jgi:hypothetical protein
MQPYTLFVPPKFHPLGESLQLFLETIADLTVLVLMAWEYLLYEHAA